MNRNSLIISLLVFYSVLFGLMAIVPYDIGQSQTVTENISQSDFMSWAPEWTEPFTSAIDNMTNRISDLPELFQIILFTPLGIIVIWLLIELAVWVTPLIGGGS